MPVDRPNNIFRSLDAKTCKTVYPKVRKNADRHFKAAEVLAAVGDHSNSIAHLILGSEELVKAFVLVLQAYDFPIKKVANYDKLFSRHSARHNLLKEFHSIYRFIEGVIAWPSWNDKQSFFNNMLKVVLYGSEMLNQAVHNYTWWDGADRLKQQCFYLDYTSLGLSDPSTIDQKSFEQAQIITRKFHKDLRLMVLIIERASPTILLNLKEAFLITGMIEQIDESITRHQGK